MLSVIRTLRLERGDIILVENPHAMEALSNAKVKLAFSVPLVFAPNGGIKTLKREDLLNLLEQLDQADAAPQMAAEASSLPL